VPARHDTKWLRADRARAGMGPCRVVLGCPNGHLYLRGRLERKGQRQRRRPAIASWWPIQEPRAAPRKKQTRRIRPLFGPRPDGIWEMHHYVVLLKGMKGEVQVGTLSAEPSLLGHTLSPPSLTPVGSGESQDAGHRWRLASWPPRVCKWIRDSWRRIHPSLA
jgi:hypothetical protein